MEFTSRVLQWRCRCLVAVRNVVSFTNVSHAGGVVSQAVGRGALLRSTGGGAQGADDQWCLPRPCNGAMLIAIT